MILAPPAATVVVEVVKVLEVGPGVAAASAKVDENGPNAPVVVGVNSPVI